MDSSPNFRQQNNASEERTALTAPSISLPKGGGAIRGIGEKFGANPVTGTGSMSAPIAASHGRLTVISLANGLIVLVKQ